MTSYHVHEVEFVPSFKILTPTRTDATFALSAQAEIKARMVAEEWTEKGIYGESVMRFLFPFLGVLCPCYRGDADCGTIILHY